MMAVEEVKRRSKKENFDKRGGDKMISMNGSYQSLITSLASRQPLLTGMNAVVAGRSGGMSVGGIGASANVGAGANVGSGFGGTGLGSTGAAGASGASATGAAGTGATNASYGTGAAGAVGTGAANASYGTGAGDANTSVDAATIQGDVRSLIESCNGRQPAFRELLMSSLNGVSSVDRMKNTVSDLSRYGRGGSWNSTNANRGNAASVDSGRSSVEKGGKRNSSVSSKNSYVEKENEARLRARKNNATAQKNSVNRQKGGASTSDDTSVRGNVYGEQGSGRQTGHGRIGRNLNDGAEAGFIQANGELTQAAIEAAAKEAKEAADKAAIGEANKAAQEAANAAASEAARIAAETAAETAAANGLLTEAAERLTETENYLTEESMTDMLAENSNAFLNAQLARLLEEAGLSSDSIDKLLNYYRESANGRTAGTFEDILAQIALDEQLNENADALHSAALEDLIDLIREMTGEDNGANIWNFGSEIARFRKFLDGKNSIQQESVDEAARNNGMTFLQGQTVREDELFAGTAGIRADLRSESARQIEADIKASMYGAGGSEDGLERISAIAGRPGSNVNTDANGNATGANGNATDVNGNAADANGKGDADGRGYAAAAMVKDDSAGAGVNADVDAKTSQQTIQQTMQQTLEQTMEQVNQQANRQTNQQAINANGFAGVVSNGTSSSEALTDNLSSQRMFTAAQLDRAALFAELEKGARIILNGDKSEMLMQLKPESLGKVTLKIVTENGCVNAKFNVENERVRQTLEANILSLKETLENQGLSVQECTVQVGKEKNANGFSEGKNWDDNWRRREGIDGVDAAERLVMDANRRAILRNQYFSDESSVQYSA